MTRKQEQAKEGNANGDDVQKYRNCFSKTKCDLQKGTLDKIRDCKEHRLNYLWPLPSLNNNSLGHMHNLN